MPRILIALLLFMASSQADEAYVPGKSYYGRNHYIEYIAGSLPFVLSAPHGGREKPDELPDREKGTFAFDTNTLELARAIDDELVARTGQHPHVIICQVTRKKIDCNREIVEGAAGNRLTEQSWNDFQGFIRSAQKSVVGQYGKGFYIDLHGHGHADARLELGYGHDRAQFGLTDAELSKPDFIKKGTLQFFALKNPSAYPALLHGPQSFGALMEKSGFPSTPSAAKPIPGEPYFNGGYNIRTHTAPETHFAGFQIESNSKGVRDTDASRKHFAAVFVEQLAIYMEAQMGLKLPLKPKKLK